MSLSFGDTYDRLCEIQKEIDHMAIALAPFEMIEDSRFKDEARDHFSLKIRNAGAKLTGLADDFEAND